jgi:hypothetical protein
VSGPVTLAVLDEEYPILELRARRAGWECAIDRDSLVVDLALSNSAGHRFHLRGHLDDYKVSPPAWTFVSKSGEEGASSAFPKQPNPPPGASHIFIMCDGKPLICLPCNRLCYGTAHKDWKLAGWTTLKPQYLTLCEMVNRIYVDLNASDGPLSE